MSYFAWIRAYSLFELCLFTGLIVAVVLGDDGAELVLGWTHGVGWILLCIAVAWGCLRHRFPWPLFAATVSPLGPVGSTGGFEVIAYRRRRRERDQARNPAPAEG